MSLFCSSECCIGTPIQQLVAERHAELLTTYVQHIHFFSDGMVELDYFEWTMLDGKYAWPGGVADGFKSLGSALSFLESQTTLIPVQAAFLKRLQVADQLGWSEEWIRPIMEQMRERLAIAA